MTSILTTMLTVMMTLTGAVALTPEASDTKQPENNKIERPVIPKVILAPVEGFDDAKSYDQSVTDRLAELKIRIGETKDVHVRVKLLVAQANQILAYKLEPACTSKLLRMDTPTAPVLQYFEQADRALDQADQALERLKDSQENQDENTAEDFRQVRRSLDVLRAFARAQRAYLLKDADDPNREARRAATGLSALVEQDDAQIKSAALLWQGCLRGQEDDPSSALSRLDFALQNIAKPTLPFSFYSRLLRCRILLDHKSYPLTLSLLLQMEERSRDWFFDAASLKQSTHTISLLRLQALNEWLEHLNENTQEEERRWCIVQMQHLIESRFDGDPKAVMRLLPAIPIVAPIPD